MRLWLAAVALASAPAGCQSSTFACQSDGACPDGRCEPQGWCSFPDVSCPSGFRFAEHAAQGLAGTCVEVGVGDTEAGSTAGGTSPTVTPATETTDNTTTTTTTGLGESETTRATDVASTTEATSSDASSSGFTGPGSSIVVTVPIAGDADDGSIFAQPDGDLVWGQSGEDGIGNGFFGEYPDGEYYVGYFRFALPAEADSATLVDARLRLQATAQVTYMWGATHAVGIWLELSPDAPVVEGPDAFPWQLGGPPTVGVTLVDASVRWPDVGPLAWVAGMNVSPDVTPLFDALVADGGTVSAGSHVQFWLTVATPTGTGGEVTYVDYANQIPTPVELELTFERP